jgi:hypothetical protein
MIKVGKQVSVHLVNKYEIGHSTHKNVKDIFWRCMASKISSQKRQRDFWIFLDFFQNYENLIIFAHSGRG